MRAVCSVAGEIVQRGSEGRGEEFKVVDEEVKCTVRRRRLNQMYRS